MQLTESRPSWFPTHHAGPMDTASMRLCTVDMGTSSRWSTMEPSSNSETYWIPFLQHFTLWSSEPLSVKNSPCHPIQTNNPVHQFFFDAGDHDDASLASNLLPDRSSDLRPIHVGQLHIESPTYNSQFLVKPKLQADSNKTVRIGDATLIKGISEHGILRVERGSYFHNDNTIYIADTEGGLLLVQVFEE